MISIIIPVHNIGDYLYFCLNSILKQTYQNFEVICIDDFSEDNSLEILEYFSFKDSRINIIKNESFKGVNFCKNQGLKVSKGEYILFLDGMNWFNFDSFEILSKTMEKNELDLLIFKNMIYSEDENKFEIQKTYDEFINKFENKIFNHYELEPSQLFSLPPNLGNILYSKLFLDKNNISLNEKIFYEDYSFFYKSMVTSEKISIINKYIYTSQSTQYLSENTINKKLSDILKISVSILNIFIERELLYNHYKKELLNYIFNMLNDNYNKIDDKNKNKFYIEIKNFYKICMKKYGLYKDILENVNKDILDAFEFENIVEKIINPPKFSIIMPVFNTEKKLHKVLDSIINQTISINEFEIIAIDDCSTDKSAKILDKYSEKYKNIEVIHLSKNSGSPSRPRNIGIENATGEYIIFQDSDDEVKNDAYEWLYKTIIEENADIVSGMFRRNIKKGIFENTYEPWIEVIGHSKDIESSNIKKILDDNNLFKFKLNSIDENPYILGDLTANSKIFRKSLFINNNIRYPVNLNGGEDSVVLFNAYVNAKTIIFINKIIFDYDVHRQDSLTHNFSLDTIWSRPKAYNLMYDIATNKNKKDIFVKIVLSKKLPYWFNNHLFKAPHIEDKEISSIFKTHQILFNECVNYNLNIQGNIIDICKDIKNNDFDEAVKKVILRRNEKLIHNC